MISKTSSGFLSLMLLFAATSALAEQPRYSRPASADKKSTALVKGAPAPLQFTRGTVCGNGLLTPDEECDDGDSVSGDGCSATCEIEPGFGCTDPVVFNAIADGGFEAGTPNAAWFESSTNFSTPLCSRDVCPGQPGRGDWWAFFGGYIGPLETGVVEQTVTIPTTASLLKFWYSVPECDSASDFARVLIDGNELDYIDGSSPLCGVTGYFEKLLTLDQFAPGGPYNDGGLHTIRIESSTFSANGGASFFFFDQLNIDDGSSPAPGSCELLANNVNCAFGPIAIPDSGGATTRGILDLTIVDAGIIDDLDVQLGVSHTWVGDLEVTLEHIETGSIVTLLDRPGVPQTSFGCQNDNIDVILDDGAVAPVETACATDPALGGTLIPEQALSAFNSEALDGDWRLSVGDFVGADTGSIEFFCLLATTQIIGDDCEPDDTQQTGCLIESHWAGDPDPEPFQQLHTFGSPSDVDWLVFETDDEVGPFGSLISTFDIRVSEKLGDEIRITLFEGSFEVDTIDCPAALSTCVLSEFAGINAPMSAKIENLSAEFGLAEDYVVELVQVSPQEDSFVQVELNPIDPAGAPAYIRAVGLLGQFSAEQFDPGFDNILTVNAWDGYVIEVWECDPDFGCFRDPTRDTAEKIAVQLVAGGIPLEPWPDPYYFTQIELPNNDNDAIPDFQDPDDDNDGVNDGADNCPLNSNPNQENNDNDALGDVCDPDDDNDGVNDGADNCPLNSNPNQENNDNDALGDVCDPDDDNDGVNDGADNCPLNSNPNQENNDNDALGDVCDPDDDNDGVNDGADNCPLNSNPNQENNDNDALGDVCDPDDDNDGVNDGADNCPLNSNPNQENNDNDALGDVCDPDDDNDGVNDGADNCPLNSNPNQENNDNDALGDVCDPDDDNDGVNDGADNCPLNSNPNQENNDNDALGDVCDPDDDNDGVNDGADNCPLNSNPNQENNDNDALGDVCDPDDDNDGVNDGPDNCPLNSNPNQENNDNDALGDVCDPDDDNDGVNDGPDNCPLNSNPNQENNDNDALGDVCDSDDDNDLVSDVEDNCVFAANADQLDHDGDSYGNACDNCTEVDNPQQIDTNGDGFGNLCDADVSNDGSINFLDLNLMKDHFFSNSSSPNWDPDFDLDSSGSVNFPDLELMKSAFFGSPGPSGLVP